MRVPAQKSVVKPGSACPKCGQRLSPLELIPVLSFVIQGENAGIAIQKYRLFIQWWNFQPLCYLYMHIPGLAGPLNFSSPVPSFLCLLLFL